MYNRQNVPASIEEEHRSIGNCLTINILNRESSDEETNDSSDEEMSDSSDEEALFDAFVEDVNETRLYRFFDVILKGLDFREKQGTSNEDIVSGLAYLAIENLECIHQKVECICQSTQIQKWDVKSVQRRQHLLYRKQVLDSYGLICDTDSDLKGRLNSTINQVEIHIIARNISILKLDKVKLKVAQKLDLYFRDECWFWFYANWWVEDLNKVYTTQDAIIIMLRILIFYDRHFFIYGRWSYSECSLLYLKFVETLVVVFYKGVTNYGLIVSFLKRLLRSPSKCRIKSSLDFIDYLLHVACTQRFDINAYERRFVDLSDEMYSDNHFASFSQLFSMLDAYIEGNVEWACLLLEHGCEIFTNSYIIPDAYIAEFSQIKQLFCRGRISEDIYHTLVAMMFYTFKAAQERIFILIWKALPYPIVNSQRITRLYKQLDYVFPDPYLILGPLQSVFERRFKVFAEGTYEPRSLKHLCRCCIRRILKMRFAHPTAIEKLGLSASLKEYLYFGCFYFDINDIR